MRVLRTLTDFRPRDVPLRVALRNTLAVVAPLAIGIATGQQAAGLAVGTGALNTMFSDQPGPYRLRMARMLAAAFGAGDCHLVRRQFEESCGPLGLAEWAWRYWALAC